MHLYARKFDRLHGAVKGFGEVKDSNKTLQHHSEEEEEEEEAEEEAEEAEEEEAEEEEIQQSRTAASKGVR